MACVPTGVKHLHHAAQHYDIGIYFEANGHGTVLFSAAATQKLHKLHNENKQWKYSAIAIDRLIAFSKLINQAVGDALSDMLLVEAVLCHLKWDATVWDCAYEDLPNRLYKVAVPDRTKFVTTDAERKLASPEGLQGKIEVAMAKVKMGRAFVRTSGTEDVVRVYAEGQTLAEAESE